MDLLCRFLSDWVLASLKNYTLPHVAPARQAALCFGHRFTLPKPSSRYDLWPPG
jgi:hypothetical protein